jgi:hypothetical protein
VGRALGSGRACGGAGRRRRESRAHVKRSEGERQGTSASWWPCSSPRPNMWGQCQCMATRWRTRPEPGQPRPRANVLVDLERWNISPLRNKKEVLLPCFVIQKLARIRWWGKKQSCSSQKVIQLCFNHQLLVRPSLKTTEPRTEKVCLQHHYNIHVATLKTDLKTSKDDDIWAG